MGRHRSPRTSRPRPARRPPGAQAANPAARFRRQHFVLLLVVAMFVLAGVFLVTRPRRGSVAPGKSPAEATAAKPASAPPVNESTNKAAELINLGNRLLADGKPAEAIVQYREAAQLLPRDEDVHYNLGIALSQLGQTNEALAEYETALKLFPDYAEAHNNLGNLLLRMRRAPEALEHLRLATRLVPDYASAHNNLGNALSLTGQPEEALQSFARAVALNTNYWEARFNWGNALAHQGRFAEAGDQYREVLRLKPDFAPAQQALAATERQVEPRAP